MRKGEDGEEGEGQIADSGKVEKGSGGGGGGVGDTKNRWKGGEGDMRKT